MNLCKKDIDEIIKSILYEFPISQISFYMPEWIMSLDEENSLKADMNSAVFDTFDGVLKISDIMGLSEKLCKYD